MSLLGSAGFDLYSSDPEHLTSQLSTLTSPILSPLSKAVDDDSSIHLLDLSATTNPISTENGAVLTRSRSSTDASAVSRSHSHKTSPSRTEAAESVSTVKVDGVKHHHLYRSQSHSPSGCDVQVLDPDLTCIGLSDDNADVWGLKILKLVAFPDLISGPHVSPSSSPVHRRRSLAVPDLAPVSGLGVALADPAEVSCEDVLSDGESDTVGSRSDDTTRVGDSPIDPDFRASCESPIFDMEPPEAWDEDVVIREEKTPRDESIAHEFLPDDSMDVLDTETPGSRPALPHLDTGKTFTPSSPIRRKQQQHRSRSHSALPPAPLVPFFSFTRTSEGSSLTAPVNLLASLFPPSERHMVICSGELDVLDSRAASPDGHRDSGEETSESEDLFSEAQGTLKCLQIDLRKFGLGAF